VLLRPQPAVLSASFAEALDRVLSAESSGKVAQGEAAYDLKRCRNNKERHLLKSTRGYRRIIRSITTPSHVFD
jgi:hypothetical protein